MVKTAAIAERKRRREEKKEEEARLRELNPPKRRSRRDRVTNSVIEDLVEESRIEVAGTPDSYFADYPDPQLTSTQSISGPYFTNGSFDEEDVRGED